MMALLCVRYTALRGRRDGLHIFVEHTFGKLRRRCTPAHAPLLQGFVTHCHREGIGFGVNGDDIAVLHQGKPTAVVIEIDRMGADTTTDKFTLLYKTHPLPGERLNALDKAIGNRFDTLKQRATLENRLLKSP